MNLHNLAATDWVAICDALFDPRAQNKPSRPLNVSSG